MRRVTQWGIAVGMLVGTAVLGIKYKGRQPTAEELEEGNRILSQMSPYIEDRYLHDWCVSMWEDDIRRGHPDFACGYYRDCPGSREFLARMRSLSEEERLAEIAWLGQISAG